MRLACVAHQRGVQFDGTREPGTSNSGQARAIRLRGFVRNDRETIGPTIA